MKKLRLIAVRSQQEEILRELMLLGCVEISAPAEEPAEELRHLSRSSGGGAYRRRTEQSAILQALRQLDRYAPYKKGLLAPLPEVKLSTLLDESALKEDLAIARKISSLDLEIRNIAAQESRERATIEAMKPWMDMDQPLEQRGTLNTELMYGSLPVITTVEAAEAALGDLPADITEIHQDGGMRYVAVVHWKGIQEEVSSALRGVGFSQIAMSGISGTPAENTGNANASLKELAARKEVAIAELAAQAPHRQALQLGADTLGTCIAREENAEKLLNSNSTFYFEGWLTAPDEAKLEEILSKYSCAWETEEPDPGHPEEIPVKLRNNNLTRPYNLVTEMYSLPSYNGLDPNPFIMPFFALFFGIMFADMAYGLILLAAGLLVTYKAKPKGGMKNIAGLLIECGITTFVLGFLTGGFFGDVVTVIGGWFGKDWHIVPHLGALHLGGVTINLPLNLMEGNNPLYVLIGAVALGFIHLVVGIGIGVYLKARDGQLLDGILNDLCWLVILAGVGLMALGKSTVVLWIGVGMMVLGAVLTGKGFGRVTGIFSAVYNGATGWLGDLLSYSRLMALMLAGSVIASVFNQLGSLGNTKGPTVGGTILFIIVFCIGHTLNFGLNIIGCFVHTLRLQYLEFFGKWYRDGGRPFRPLTIKTKFVDIIEEE